MSSVRLHPAQIERLRKSGQGPRIIAYALKRWQRGDFVIDCSKKREKGAALLQIYPIWRKPEGVSDAQLRAILDAHFATPDVELHNRLTKEIAYLDGVIAQEFAMLAAKGPFIIETTPEENGD